MAELATAPHDITDAVDVVALANRMIATVGNEATWAWPQCVADLRVRSMAVADGRVDLSSRGVLLGNL